MLTFVALPCSLMLLTLCRLGLIVPLEDPVNRPDSSRRWSDAPDDVDVELVTDPAGGEQRFTYPRNTAELVVTAAARFESPERWQRLQGIQIWRGGQACARTTLRSRCLGSPAP